MQGVGGESAFYPHVIATCTGRKKGTSSRFLTHNFSCRRVNVLFLWCYVLTHKFSFHCEKDCLRSPDCEKTGQLAPRKRYASERACFWPSTAQIPVKIYKSNAKSYSTNDNGGFYRVLPSLDRPPRRERIRTRCPAPGRGRIHRHRPACRG